MNSYVTRWLLQAWGYIHPVLRRVSCLIDKNGSRLSNQELGVYGESIACAYLMKCGIQVLTRNFRAHGGGEVDIIARCGKQLLFIEVKTRQQSSTIRPLSAVDREKQKLIERGGHAYLKKIKRPHIPWRFDVIEVRVAHQQVPQVNHIKNAF